MLPPLGEVPRSGNGVSKRTGAQGAIATEHPVRRHPAQSMCICGASRCQQSPFSKGGCHVVTEGFWWVLWTKPISFHHHLSWPATKGKLFYGQVKSQLGPASQVLCRACAQVGSSLLGREPAAESITRYLCRVIRIPIAAKPRDLNSQCYSQIFLFRRRLFSFPNRWQPAAGSPHTFERHPTTYIPARRA